MSLLGSLAKGALGMVLGGNKGGIASVLGELLSPQNGGLDNLTRKFESAGLGDMIKSWISTGPNPPVSADQLHNALGADTVAKLAKSAGIKPEILLGMLATQLPGIIDKLTPQGTAPAADDLQKGLKDVLGSLMAGKN